MKDIQDIFSVVKEIETVANNPKLVAEIQNLSRSQTNTAGQVISQNINQIIDNIKKLIDTIDTSLWTNEHWGVAKILGVEKVIGPKGSKYLDDIKASILTNPASRVSLIATLTADLNALRAKPKQLSTLLNDFDIKSNILKISEEEGIIEIKFDGKVEIEDFKEAKDQMNDWFIIIEGYARLLNIPRQEFEIIGISKNSPTTFKLKTSLKNVGLVLGVLTSLLMIQRSYLDNQLLLEKLRQTSLGPDAEGQKQFIENAEKHIEKEINEKIEALVDKKMTEYNIEENKGDIKASLSKGIENQYNFINNGGNINIYINNGEMKPQIEQLINTKEDIKNIRTSYELQKSISSGDTIGQEKLDLE